jgi:molybdate transport system permease protein
MTSQSTARRGRRRGGAGVGVLPILGGLAAVFLALPLLGLLQRTPWSDLGDLLTDPAATAALGLSLQVAIAATVLATLLGVPLAWLLARTRFPGRSVVRALVLLPMVLPPVVGGVALLYALGRRGLVGQYLYDWFDITLPFTRAGAVLAATFVAMPFLVITVESGLRSLDPGYEEAARTLGANRATTFWRVTLPLLAPQLAAGAALAFARALGEFGATITFAGNVEGRTRTLPLAIYTALQTDREAALALSVVLLAVSLVVLVLLRDRVVGGGS